MHQREQRARLERFLQEVHGARLQRSHGRRHGAEPGEEDDGRSVGGGGQAFLELESAQVGQPEVDDDAALFAMLPTREKAPGRLERPRREPFGAHQHGDRIAHRRIIVDHEDDRAAARGPVVRHGQSGPRRSLSAPPARCRRRGRQPCRCVRAWRMSTTSPRTARAVSAHAHPGRNTGFYVCDGTGRPLFLQPMCPDSFRMSRSSLVSADIRPRGAGAEPVTIIGRSPANPAPGAAAPG